MPPPRPRRDARPRRAAHSREQILETAIALLDAGGIRGLTLRALAVELGGGLGSVYWHVEGKDEVIALACDELIGAALTAAGPDAGEADVDGRVAELRRVAMALFDQTQAHPWLAPQLLVQSSLGAANGLRYWERLGRPLAAMGLTPRQQFDGSTAINGYVQGVAAVMAAQDVQADPDRPARAQLDEARDQLLATDPTEFAWIHSIAPVFAGHDDAEQFAAGLDLLLGGLRRQALESR